MEAVLPIQIRGKSIGAGELQVIRELIEDSAGITRRQVSLAVCQEFGWRQPNGQWQDAACREILIRLEKMGWIQLPASRWGTEKKRERAEDSGQGEFEFIPVPIEGTLGSCNKIELEPVQGQEQFQGFRKMMETHHYLGYSWVVGRSLKYWVRLDGQVVGGMAWGSACWKLGPRDRLIGWNAEQRRMHLQRLAGNHRFLLLPHVRVKNLASAVLAKAIKQVAQDWPAVYGISLELLESFVDPSRFKGSCYRAANWIYLGQSRGSSKRGNFYYYHGEVKDIYVYPLRGDFKERLCAG
jgi:hypothetical protein